MLRVYRERLDSNLFSVNRNELYFFKDDIESLNFNNNTANVVCLNLMLNRLSLKLKKMGIQLIIFIAPDKYDFYYEYISRRLDYTKPLFFDLMDMMQKEYTYFNSKKVLKDSMSRYKDLYFYDDSHWSPVGTRIIGSYIYDIIRRDKENNQKTK